MFSSFWHEVLRPQAGLFESCGGGYLPRPDAPAEQLAAVGLAMTKCVIDEHPVGHGVCGFVFEYIVHQAEAAALHDTFAALDALEEYDAQCAARRPSPCRTATTLLGGMT